MNWRSNNAKEFNFVIFILLLIGVSFAWGCGGEEGTITGEGNIAIDGGTYTGQLVNGVANGFGTYEHPDGISYEGEFKDNLPHGQDTYILSGGPDSIGVAMYEGGVKDSEKYGQGTITHTDGSILNGRWENGKYIIE